jgi:hypothetical protein
MRSTKKVYTFVLCFFIITAFAFYGNPKENQKAPMPKLILTPIPKFLFNSFVDCNMAEAWIDDTFRIFPGKYGEDPVWGPARDLKFANGRNPDEAFGRKSTEFAEPLMPKNAAPGTPGLHGAVWFETVYQDTKDKTGKTLYAVYHNENYPATLPYNFSTGNGYIDQRWPQGLTDAKSPAAVCRIGIMKSTNGGHSWNNRGLFIEDLQPRMILKPHNNSVTFAGGVGDPSAVASGDYLYLFYGEYGYPGMYDSASYDPVKEWKGQCISVARIRLSDLDNPKDKANRWDGTAFAAPWNGIGQPISSLQIPMNEGGGPASSAKAGFHWGPSVSWNTYLNCWVMLTAEATGPSWKGSRIFVSYNFHKNLGEKDNSQKWTKPELIIDKPGHIIWYPSLQPLNTPEDIRNKVTCLRLGQKARLFYKVQDKGEYLSEYLVEFKK